MTSNQTGGGFKFPWGHHRRFNAYAPYFKNLFGDRVQKISVDGGFSCPNRDGTKGRGGCTYCNNNAFNPSYCSSEKSIAEQVREGIEFHKIRYRRANKYLVYFQAYSNTYESLDKLKVFYESALSYPGVVGLVIGTRADCMTKEILSYLHFLSRQYFIVVEYGVESIYNETLERINRKELFKDVRNTIHQTAETGLHVGAHFIFGLPGESREMMMNSVDEINKLPLTSIKFHQLQIIEGTAMAADYKNNPGEYDLFSFEEYNDFIIRFTEKLNPGFIIERFAGEVPPRFLVGPGWGLIRNDQINAAIELELEQRNSWQGKYFEKEH